MEANTSALQPTWEPSVLSRQCRVLSVRLFVCLSVYLSAGSRPRLRVTQKAARNAEFLLLLGTGAR